MAWQLITGRAASRLCDLGWKSLGVLELTAVPSIKVEYWVTAVQETDALLARECPAGNIRGVLHPVIARCSR